MKKPSDLFYSLMEAAQEQGIEQTKGEHLGASRGRAHQDLPGRDGQAEGGEGEGRVSMFPLADRLTTWLEEVPGSLIKSRAFLHSKFKESDYLELIGMARHRNDAKVSGGLDKMVAQSDPLLINYDGLKGEWAWARLCGKEVQQLPGLLEGDGGDKDLVIGDRSYQVKYTNHRKGYFYLPRGKELKADYGVLCVRGKGRDLTYLESSKTVIFIGFCTREIWEDKRAPCPFDKSALGLHQSILTPIAEIPGIKRERMLFG